MWRIIYICYNIYIYNVDLTFVYLFMFVYSEASHKVAALSTFYFFGHLGESEKLAELTAGALAAAHSVRDLATVGVWCDISIMGKAPRQGGTPKFGWIEVVYFAALKFDGLW